MANAPVTGWKVTGQVETMDRGPDGRAVAGMKVSFQTGKGVFASVFIPSDRYTPDNVRAAIASAAAQIDQVHTLSG